MIEIKDKFKLEVDLEKYFNEQNVCFIDIETTGLSSRYCSIYLIGILSYNPIDKMWCLTQLLAESIEEEKDLLLCFKDIVSKFDRIVSFNGDTFDIPFINNRLDKFNIDYVISLDSSFDLYKYIRENKNYLNLENLKLKTLERSLGIHRDDLYSGKECIKFYKDYVTTKNTEYKNIILKHNYDDLYYLTFILQILDIIDNIKTIRLKLKDSIIDLKIDKINCSGDLFLIKGTFIGDISLQYYDMSYRVLLNNDNTFEIALEYSLGMVTKEKKALFIDKRKLVPLKDIENSTNYKIPYNILLLQVEKEYCIDNIKEIVKCLIKGSI